MKKIHLQFAIFVTLIFQGCQTFSYQVSDTPTRITVCGRVDSLSSIKYRYQWAYIGSHRVAFKVNPKVGDSVNVFVTRRW